MTFNKIVCSLLEGFNAPIGTNRRTPTPTYNTVNPMFNKNYPRPQGFKGDSINPKFKKVNIRDVGKTRGYLPSDEETHLKHIGNSKNKNLIRRLFGSISKFERLTKNKNTLIYKNIKVIYNKRNKFYNFYFI